ncbi:MAG: 4Fe-4S dicluster domain-containing protein, partial [Acidobacteriota bacterium]
IPGVPQQFATVLERSGAATGVLVTSYDGRPVKIEGNPLHPASQGAADALMQASLLELYDPDRSRQVIRREGGQTVAQSWDDFLAQAMPHFAALRQRGGERLAVLAEASSSPSLRRLRRRFAETLPQAHWYEYEPLSRDNERAGTALLFGKPHRPLLHLDRARVIVSLDADLLGDHPAALAHARGFAGTRRAEGGAMSRLWVAESVLSLTGAAADHRVATPARRIAPLAAQLVGQLIAHLKSSDFGPLEDFVQLLARVAGAPVAPGFVAGALADLENVLGQAVVIAGPRQPAEVHALAHLANVALGVVGNTITYVADQDGERPDHVEALAALVAAMGSGAVDTLLILGGNPAYDAPADLDFATSLKKVPTTVRLGLFDDETSQLCTWHLPRSHALESWGDARAWDGTISVAQPLIEPLYGGKTALELVALVLGESVTASHEIVRETLRQMSGTPDFEGVWRRTLHDGVLAGSAFPEVRPQEQLAALADRAGALAGGSAGAAEVGALEAVFVADASVHDGRFANNAWLQELPDPLTRLTWGNAALLSPATAAALSVATGDLLRLSLGGCELEIAAYILPGQPDGSVALPLGYGRRAAGKAGNGVGFDTYRLRRRAAMGFDSGLTVTRTGARYRLAMTQDHHAIDRVGFAERGLRIGSLVREGTLAEYLAHPEFVKEQAEHPAPSPLFRELAYDGEHQWAMAIDLSACIGCGACAVACQAENNIAVVGKDQVARGREMHWIRVDRYFGGPPEDPRVVFQPVACQHCENAPCEQVCPVGATVHSREGLNEMVYNRCVGTRYCSNNCPYKVRRFNFLNYYKSFAAVEKMAHNPEVTVRSRGVMEKCTYCVQRIEAVKIAAGNERRPIRDGEITPACAQTCPAQAIVFGDLRDRASRVAALRAHQRAYGLLAELHTEGRTTYLAKLRNPASASEGA